MFLRAYPHGSASIAALAGGEIWANQQVCPTIVGFCAEVRLCFNGPDFQFAIVGFIGYLANMTMAENKFLKEAIRQGLRMQHRFLAEPVLARTGKGYMKSEGVATLQRIKASMKKSKSV